MEWTSKFLPSLSHAIRADAGGVKLLWSKRGPSDKRRSGWVIVDSTDGTLVCKITGAFDAAKDAYKLELKCHDQNEDETEYSKIIESEEFDTLFYGADCGTDNWLYPWLILDIPKFRTLTQTDQYKIERGETWGNVRSGDSGYTRWIDLRRASKIDPSIIRDKSGFRKDAFPRRLARKLMDKTFFYNLKGPMSAHRVNEILSVSTVLPNGAVLTPLGMSNYQFLRAVAERKGRL